MIIGHKRQLNYLEGIISSGRIPHAFIFYGPNFVGKKLIAFAFFWRMLGRTNTWKEFFKSKEYTSFLNGENADVFVLSKDPDKKEIGIGDIKKLRRFVELSPFNLSKKLVLVDGADSLSRQAYNSLLKTLEEPSDNTIIILISSSLSGLPQTVRSRSVALGFNTVDRGPLAKGLKEQSLQIKEKDLAWIAGRPGLALRCAKDPKDEFITLFREQFFNFLDLIKEKSIIANMSVAAKVFNDPMLDQILEAWIMALRYQISTKEKETSLGLLKELSRTKQLLLKTNTNKRLQLESMLVSMCL